MSAAVTKAMRIAAAILRDIVQNSGQNIKKIIVGVISLILALLLFFLIPITIHERAPVATYEQALWYYNAAKAVSETTQSPCDDGVYVDWQDVIAIDAVRYKQNFKKSSAQKARELTGMFIEQTGSCEKCSGEGEEKSCESYPVYRLRSIDEVMQMLGVSQADQEKVISQYRVIDFNFLIGFEPDVVADYDALFSGDLSWPLPGNHTISSPFGPRTNPITGVKSFHYGIDVPAGAGTPIKAAAEGKVKSVKWSDAVGWTVVIDHGLDAAGKRLATRYLHCMDTQVRAGQTVKAGQTICSVGDHANMGYLSTGPHLHFETMVDDVNKDPAGFFTQKN